MKFEITNRTPEELKPEAVLAWILEDVDGVQGMADGAAAAELTEALERAAFQPKPGQVFLARPASLGHAVLVAGLGRKDGVEEETIRRAAGAAQGRLRQDGVKTLAVTLPGLLPMRDEVRVITEGLLLSAYRFTKYSSDEKEIARQASLDLEQVHVCAGEEDQARQGAHLGEATARGICYARDLVNLPSQDKRPPGLAETAKELAGRGVEVQVLDDEECRTMGMGAFLGVGQGSDAPPRLIHLHYKPEGAPRGKVAVVGKGVTFDSGGLNLKSYEHMQDMKQDMGGAACVLGLFSVLPDLGLPVEVHGVVAAAENMPSGTAIRPGDVLTAMSGKTIEVINTDAEGRLTLADALGYAEKQGVDEIVDLATLTGSCVVALGKATGIFGRPQEICDRVLEACRKSGDRAWQLPLFDDYRKMIRGGVADIKNAAGRWGGAITAALFLDEFVSKKTPWVHMDIAGSAFADEALPTCPKGGTGVSVGSLIRYLEQIAMGQEG